MWLVTVRPCVAVALRWLGMTSRVPLFTKHARPDFAL
jgi:hypothetical protein